MFQALWLFYSRWQTRRWRAWADHVLVTHNSHLEQEVARQAKLLEIREVEVEQAQEIIARDRARIQAESAAYAREIAKAP